MVIPTLSNETGVPAAAHSAANTTSVTPSPSNSSFSQDRCTSSIGVMYSDFSTCSDVEAAFGTSPTIQYIDLLSYLTDMGDLSSTNRLLDLAKTNHALNIYACACICGFYEVGAKHIKKDKALAATMAGKCVSWLTEEAKLGNGFAQSTKAVFHLVGLGMRKDPDEARRLLQLAASQGNCPGQYILGLCLENGIGGAVDKEEAMRYYTLAADRGYAFAQFGLGKLFMTLDFGDVGVQKALVLYHKSADQGYGKAQLSLGLHYEHGLAGLSADPVKAFKYYLGAAERNEEFAQYQLAQCYQLGNGVDMNQFEAFKWYKAAADNGSAIAQNNLAFSYLTGRGCTVNIAEALRYLRLASDNGFDKAQNALAKFLYDGTYSQYGITKNKAESKRLYKLAAAQGNADATEALKKFWF